MYVKFSPDGRTALILSNSCLSGLPGGKVVLWDVETGAVIYDLPGHEFVPRTAAFSPDGRTALIGTLQWGNAWDEEGVKGELVLWDLATGQEIRRFGPTRSVLEVSFSPDGRTVVTADSVYDYVSLFDVATGQWIRQFDAFSHTVTYTSDPRYFLTASQGGSTLLMDAETGDVVRRFTGQTASFWALAVSPDQKYLLGGGSQGMLALWNFETEEEIQRFRGHSASTIIWKLVFHPDGQTAFSAALDPQGDVIQWRIADWPLDELLPWVHENRYVRAFTCEERAQYRIEPLCK